MYTAKDMHTDLMLEIHSKGEMVDTWLKEVVLPTYKPKAGYKIPKHWGLSLRQVETLLSMRGFSVKTHSDHQGNFVYLTIPPQGE